MGNTLAPYRMNSLCKHSNFRFEEVYMAIIASMHASQWHGRCASVVEVIGIGYMKKIVSHHSYCVKAITTTLKGSTIKLGFSILTK